MGIGPINGGAMGALRSRAAAMPTGKAVVLAGGVAAGSAGVGVYAMSQRGSVPWQGIAYGGIIGLASTVPLFAAGKVSARIGIHRADKLLNKGTIDQAQHAAQLLEIKGRTSGPARNMFIGTAGLAVGAVSTNIATPHIERSVSDAIIEQQSNGAPAEKKPEEGASETAPAGG